MTDIAKIGLAVNRPGAWGMRERIYVATDTGESWISDGQTWYALGAAAGAGGSDLLAYASSGDQANYAINGAASEVFTELAITVPGDNENEILIEAFVHVSLTNIDSDANFILGIAEDGTPGDVWGAREVDREGEGVDSHQGGYYIAGVLPPFAGSKNLVMSAWVGVAEEWTLSGPGLFYGANGPQLGYLSARTLSV